MSRFLILFFCLYIANYGYSQCTNTVQYPSQVINASANNDTVIISSNSIAGDYALIDDLISGHSYVFISQTAGDYITIRDYYDHSTLLDHGLAPFTYTATTHKVSMHINLSSPTCGNDFIVRQTSIHCSTCPDIPNKVEVENGYLEVEGEIVVGELGATPQAGMIKWNPISQDFEGYTGDKWVSLTKSSQEGQWGSHSISSMEPDQRVTGSSTHTNDNFGYSVAIQGDFAVVGSNQDYVSGNTNQGSAYIFQKSGNSWNEVVRLTASDGNTNDRFGHSVAISGDFVVVGARRADGASVDQGAAYVFVRSGTAWTQQAKLTANDGQMFDDFGQSVGIDEDYIIVGATTTEFEFNVNPGSAYIFHRDGSTWSQQDKLTVSGGVNFDRFGYDVDIDGNIVIIGAPLDDVGSGTDQGTVYTFERSGTNWTLDDQINTISNLDYGYFGRSVSIDGIYALIGAPGISSNRGEAYIYVYEDISSSWWLTEYVTLEDGSPNDEFGDAVSLDGDFAVVRARYAKDKGAVYLFKKEGVYWPLQSVLTATDGESDNRFGNAVDIEGDQVIVGEFLDEISGTNRGSVHFISKK